MRYCYYISTILSLVSYMYASYARYYYYRCSGGAIAHSSILYIIILTFFFKYIIFNAVTPQELGLELSTVYYYIYYYTNS